MSLGETKESFNDVSMCLNKKFHMLLKTEINLYIHDDEVNNIAECNLLHDIINPHKRAKNINSHYYPILRGCMNNRKFRA